MQPDNTRMARPSQELGPGKWRNASQPRNEKQSEPTNLDVSSGLRYTHRAPISEQNEHDGLAASHRVFLDRHTSHATLTRFLG